MDSMLLCPQMLTTLAGDAHVVLYEPNKPSKALAQLSRAGTTYYLAGPLFIDRSSVKLEHYLRAVRSNGRQEAEGITLLNELLAQEGVSPEAHIFICSDLSDAIYTLDGLLAAYSLT
jgi:hypothetical protein